MHSNDSLPQEHERDDVEGEGGNIMDLHIQGSG